MIQRIVNGYKGQEVFYCDENCNKAWGVDCRPSIQLDPDNDDDVVFLADYELGDAPEDTGTYEGLEMCGKPKTKEERLNKWCFRNCERGCTSKVGEELVLKNWNVRVYNIPRKNDE